MSELEDIALEVSELDTRARECFVKGDLEQCFHHFDQMREKISDVKKTLMEKHVPHGLDEKAYSIIRAIAAGEMLPMERILDNLFSNKLPPVEPSEEEFEQLASDKFYSWFSGRDYVENLFHMNALVLKIGKIPERLDRFVSEIRTCYALQQPLAVVVLCRTILDICLNDVYRQKWAGDHNANQVTSGETHTKDLYQLIEELTDGDLRNKMHKVRRATNQCIHGQSIDPGALDVFKETIESIQALYARI